jgi:hypothetical protein
MSGGGFWVEDPGDCPLLAPWVGGQLRDGGLAGLGLGWLVVVLVGGINDQIGLRSIFNVIKNVMAVHVVISFIVSVIGCL